MPLPSHLRGCADVLRDVGLAQADGQRREAILAAVYGDLSDRNLADVLHEVLCGDVHRLLREVIVSHESLADSRAVVDARGILAAAGWEFDDR